MYTSSTEGRYARAKRLQEEKEARESALKKQKEQLAALVSKSVTNSVSPSTNRQAPALQNHLTTLPGVKKPVVVPPHLQQINQMMKDAQSQNKRLRMDIAAVEKQQQATSQNLTQAKVAQIQHLAASRGLTTDQVIELVNRNQQATEDSDDEEEEDESVNAFQELMLRQNELLKELKQSQEQNSMQFDLMAKILLPPAPPVITEQMTNNEQQVANSLVNRQSNYANILKRINDEQQKQNQYKDMARLIQSVSSNPEVSRFLPQNSAEKSDSSSTKGDNENQSGSRALNGKRKRNSAKSKKNTSAEELEEDSFDQTDDVNDLVRRILQS